MAPNTTQDEDVLVKEPDDLPKLVAPQADAWRFQLSYSNIILFAYWHLAAIYGLYLCFTSARWPTIFFAAILTVAGTLGTFVGAHRLWSHKSFKAKLPLEVILIFLQTLGGQNSVHTWVRDHRLHHRYSDTDGDPHNSTRGLFFSHIGWALAQRHPAVKRRGKHIDLSDILNNRLIMFQKKYAAIVFSLIGFVIPTVIPMYYWNESFNNSYHLNTLRFIITLTGTCLINSAAHAFGNRPYDVNIKATENLAVMLTTLGEGSHNYHHVFPWDYRAAELSSRLNLSKSFIDFFAWVGWAYDLKIVDPKTVETRILRNGDGTYSYVGED